MSNRQWTIIASLAFLILLVGLIPLAGLLTSPTQAVAQSVVTLNPNPAAAGTKVAALAEDTIAGDWQFDVEVYRLLQSDGRIREENLHYTIVARLREIENGFTGSYIDASSNACKVAEISGTIQNNQVNWVVHYTGSCCQDARMMFQGTISPDRKTMTGTMSPVRPPSPGCELWWANVTGTKVAASAPPDAKPTITLAVQGNQPWTDTGLNLNKSDQVTISASGVIRVGLPSGYTPEGDPACTGSIGTPHVAPGLPCWSLIGRIGDGAPFFVGAKKSFVAEASGRLYLGVNDETRYFGDNSGSWTVNITISIAGNEKPACPKPTVTLSTYWVRIGDTIAVQGKDWLPGGTVAFTVTGPTQFNMPPVPVPDSGEWEIPLGIGDAPPGNYSLMFSENHEGCELRVTQPFTISADTQFPTLSWVKPVGNLAVYSTSSGRVDLELTASDSSGIARVGMWRFGATGERVLIAEFTSPPYRASLDVSTLDVGWNEIIAAAADNAGNWGDASIWVERVATTQPSPEVPFYCITGPSGRCSVPPAPGQLPAPPAQPPLDSKESQVEAVQDLVVCVGDVTGTTWYVEYLPVFIDILEGKWYGIIPYSSCLQLLGEIKPLTEFALLEEIEILRMYFEGTYRISVQVVCDNKDQFGHLAQSLC